MIRESVGQRTRYEPQPVPDDADDGEEEQVPKPDGFSWDIYGLEFEEVITMFQNRDERLLLKSENPARQARSYSEYRMNLDKTESITKERLSDLLQKRVEQQLNNTWMRRDSLEATMAGTLGGLTTWHPPPLFTPIDMLRVLHTSLVKEISA